MSNDEGPGWHWAPPSVWHGSFFGATGTTVATVPLAVAATLLDGRYGLSTAVGHGLLGSLQAHGNARHFHSRGAAEWLPHTVRNFVLVVFMGTASGLAGSLLGEVMLGGWPAAVKTLPISDATASFVKVASWTAYLGMVLTAGRVAGVTAISACVVSMLVVAERAFRRAWLEAVHGATAGAWGTSSSTPTGN